MPTQGVGYLRVSGNGQISGDGFPRQIEAISAYADALGLEIVQWYRDEGLSGKLELENRPGLAACLERVENNGIKIVLVESADRLARDSMIAELIIRQFQRAQCQVISASGGVDLTAGDDSNPIAKLIRQVLAAVAEFDRCVTVLKLRAARERRRTNGIRCEGRKPYGFRDGEFEILQRIIKLRKSGYKPQKIAARLNEDQLLTRYGKPWNRGTVCKILERQKAK